MDGSMVVSILGASASVIGALVTAVGAVIAWGNLRAAKNQVKIAQEVGADAKQQLKNAERQTEIAKDQAENAKKQTDMMSKQLELITIKSGIIALRERKSYIINCLNSFLDKSRCVALTEPNSKLHKTEVCTPKHTEILDELRTLLTGNADILDGCFTELLLRLDAFFEGNSAKENYEIIDELHNAESSVEEMWKQAEPSIDGRIAELNKRLTLL